MNYQTQFDPEDRLLSFPETMEMTGLTRSRIYDLKAHKLFPEPIKISRHRVAFLESEVRAFINSRIAERNKKLSLEGAEK